MIRIRVPATTANMGPGFDCIGMALNLYNEVTIEETEGETEVVYNGEPFYIPLSENLTYTSMIDVLDKYNYKYKGFKINMITCDIPVSRGLGSSAACIIMGITAANKLLGNVLTKQDIIDIAVKIEGHPDNVIPALVGDMVVAINEDGKIIYSKIPVPEKLRFVVMIPEFKVSTKLARESLLQDYSREDCVFNISRAASLVSAMYTGNFKNMRTYFDDKIHQPYRKKFIKGIEGIFNKSKEFGALGEFISGSGSTIMAVIDKDYDLFVGNMEKYLKEIEGNWRLVLLKTDKTGVKSY